jgi:diaminohydroxyphosphoribosylaminopyrimidine deaminase/5-amino-6-(5-phosphoribosylamino)uracil reductase
LRIVIDRSLRLDPSLHLFDGKRPTICFNTIKNEEKNNLAFVKVEGDNFCQSVATDLFSRNVQSLVVEGGSETLSLFISSGLWDEARVLVSNTVYENGVKAPSLPGDLVSTTDVGGDTLSVYQNFSVRPLPV